MGEGDTGKGEGTGDRGTWDSAANQVAVPSMIWLLEDEPPPSSHLVLGSKPFADSTLRIPGLANNAVE